MTLKYFAETYSKDYNFWVTDEKGKNLGKFERNELVKLDYAIAECEVIKFCNNPVELNCFIVAVKR